MIKSMTGFGRGEFVDTSFKITTEIRSVNSRFLELKFRGYAVDLETERSIRIMFEKRLNRGNVSIRIEIQNLIESNNVIFDKERFELARNILKEIHVSYGQKINLSDIISFQDLLKSDYSKKMNNEDILKSVSDALNQLDEMRIQEGFNIHSDLTKRVNALKLSIISAEKISSNYSSEKQKSLSAKILDLLGSKVDLPQPDGPTKTTNSPFSISNPTLRMTSVLPNALFTSLNSTWAI